LRSSRAHAVMRGFGGGGSALRRDRRSGGRRGTWSVITGDTHRNYNYEKQSRKQETGRSGLRGGRDCRYRQTRRQLNRGLYRGSYRSLPYRGCIAVPIFTGWLGLFIDSRSISAISYISYQRRAKKAALQAKRRQQASAVSSSREPDLKGIMYHPHLLFTGMRWGRSGHG
jgi:hypothetical protein